MKKIISASLFIAVLAMNPLSALAQRPDNTGQERQNVEVTQVRESAQERAEERKVSAQERKEAIRKQVEDRRVEVRQEVCERRSQNIQRVIPRLSQSATTLKKNMDTMFERVQGFYEKGQLTVENYDELVEDVEVAKVDSEASLETLEEYKFELDCENQNVGQQLDSYRTAVKETRAELKEYRSALVELISSMRAAVATDKDDGAEVTEENGTSEQQEQQSEGTSEGAN